MASNVSGEVVIAVSMERFFELVTDYTRYPEFVPNMKTVRLKGVRPNGEKEVEYELDVGLRRIRYTLLQHEEPPSRVTWSLISGDLMKKSSGSWELADEGGKTRARYTVEIQISKPPLIPQSIVDRVSEELTRVQLPRAMQAFKARAEGRARGSGGRTD
jgi:ribosome-associated toxin RatA of RatAB toxin-antitoxin module